MRRDHFSSIAWERCTGHEITSASTEDHASPTLAETSSIFKLRSDVDRSSVSVICRSCGPSCSHQASSRRIRMCRRWIGSQTLQGPGLPDACVIDSMPFYGLVGCILTHWLPLFEGLASPISVKMSVGVAWLAIHLVLYAGGDPSSGFEHDN